LIAPIEMLLDACVEYLAGRRWSSWGHAYEDEHGKGSRLQDTRKGKK
jgi:hypothetical protein